MTNDINRYILLNMRIINFYITARDEGKQIKEYLKGFGVSSSLLAKLKQSENGITKNGVFAKSIETLNSGDTLTIRIENRGNMPTPLKADIEIIYEDDDLIVLNKPPKMPVHESRNHIGDTLSNFVSYHLEEDTAFRAVYRLDRDTSGLVVCAKHMLAAAKLAGKIKKDYFAVVSGIIEEGGVVDIPIMRCGDSIIKRKAQKGGERAITHYEPISRKGGNTLLKLTLETGRTHQIRVHMSYIGHPLLGDTLYGGSDTLINRQALHCREVYFTHPITEKEMHLSCDFPDDIKELI